MIDEWLNLLRNATRDEFADRPVLMTLATVSRNQRPRARMIVCRAIDDDGTIWIIADARSRKNRQIRDEPRVEILFWLPSLRRQFRIRGKAAIERSNHPRSMHLWKSIPDATRAMFTWPTPGDQRAMNNEAFARSLPADAIAPEYFEAIAIHPTFVEELDLNPHPHRRRRWRHKCKWITEELNP